MINNILNRHTLQKDKFNGGTLEGAVACFAFSAGCFALRYAIIKIGEKTVGTCKVCKKVIRDEMGKSLLNGGDRNIKYEIGTIMCAVGIGQYDLNKEMPICPDCWSKMIRERISIQRARLCRRTGSPVPQWFDEEDEESKYKQKKITKYFKKNSNSPSRNSPSRNSPTRNSPSRNSPTRNSPSRNSPKFLDGNRINDKIKEEINKNYPELTSIQKNKLYETLLKTELHWKKGGKKEEKSRKKVGKKVEKRRKKGGKKEEKRRKKNYTK